MTALQDLLAKVEKGKVPQWFNWNSGIKGHGTNARLAYNGSLDASKALHEAVLPGWWCEIRMSTRPRAVVGYIDAASEGQDDTPARSWLIAILRSLIAQEGEA